MATYLLGEKVLILPYKLKLKQMKEIKRIIKAIETMRAPGQPYMLFNAQDPNIMVFLGTMRMAFLEQQKQEIDEYLILTVKEGLELTKSDLRHLNESKQLCEQVMGIIKKKLALNLN